MTESAFLSDEEVQDLTGYQQPKRQARWLAENGIRAFVNARGRVRVPRDAVSVKPGGQKPQKTEPDFSCVRRAG